MDVRSNEPYWLIKNPLPTSYPSLRKDISADIVIVGAGITGALMAYKLLETGKKIVILDRRDVCNGSTAASTSMLQYEIDVPLHKLIEQRGLTIAVSSYKDCEASIFKLKEIVEQIKSDCDFRFRKSLYFCSTEKDLDFLRKEFETRKEHDIEVKWLKKVELKKMGLNAFAGIESASGACMDVYRFANDLLTYCSSKGVEIYDKTEVVEISHSEKGIEIKTPQGLVSTKDIVHCTGYESVNTLKEDIIDLKSTYAIISESFKELPKIFKEYILWNTDEPYLYFRSTPDKRIIAGGEDDNFKNAKKRDAKIDSKKATIEKKFQQTFPKVNYIPDYAWAGTFGETKDGLPYMGKPNPDKNEHYILGFGGNGITFSVMGMDAIINSLEDKPHTYLEYYRFNR